MAFPAGVFPVNAITLIADRARRILAGAEKAAREFGRNSTELNRDGTAAGSSRARSGSSAPNELT